MIVGFGDTGQEGRRRKRANFFVPTDRWPVHVESSMVPIRNSPVLSSPTDDLGRHRSHEMPTSLESEEFDHGSVCQERSPQCLYHDPSCVPATHLETSELPSHPLTSNDCSKTWPLLAEMMNFLESSFGTLTSSRKSKRQGQEN